MLLPHWDILSSGGCVVSAAGHTWLLGSRLDHEVPDTDQYLYTRFRQKWDEIGVSQQSTYVLEEYFWHVYASAFIKQCKKICFHLVWSSLCISRSCVDFRMFPQFLPDFLAVVHLGQKWTDNVLERSEINVNTVRDVIGTQFRIIWVDFYHKHFNCMPLLF